MDDAEVRHLAGVITDAEQREAAGSPYALALAILDAGYQRLEVTRAVVALLDALDGDSYPFLVEVGALPDRRPESCEDCGRTVWSELTPVWDGTRTVMVGPRCWRKRMAVVPHSAEQLQLAHNEEGPS